MSTITKLDPRVRTSRRERRDTARSLGRVVSQLSGFQQVRAAAVHTVLVEIIRAPTLTGARKHALFNNLINKLQEAA